jgi:hypothetical protein
METERLYFYHVYPSGKWTLDVRCNVNVPHHVLRDGIAYETSKTPQLHLQNLGRKNPGRSGMGGVYGRRRGLRVRIEVDGRTLTRSGP